MASSTLTVEVLRLKRLFQHPDIAVTTSPQVHVALSHPLLTPDGKDQTATASLQRTTRSAKEEHSPFYNETFTFDVSAIFRASPASRPAAQGDSSGSAGVILGRPPRSYVAEAKAQRAAARGRPAQAGTDAGGAPDETDASTPVSTDVDIAFEVYDTNKHPAMFVARVAFPGGADVAKDSRREETLTLVRDADPSCDDCGALTVRVTVKTVREEAPAVDVDADVLLPYTPKLTGDYELVPVDRLNTWYHVTHDGAWRERVGRAIVAAYPPEATGKSVAGSGKKAAAGRAAASLGASMKSASGAAAADGAGGGSEGPHPLQAVVQHRWKVRRLHQFYTKYRLAAERQLEGEPLNWTPEEELRQKSLWVDGAAVRSAAVSGPSKKVHAALERAWVYYLTGELPSDAPGAMLSFEHRSKMGSATFARAAYEALVGTMIEMTEPHLAGAPIVAAIAKETFEADALAAGSKAFKAAQEAAQKAAQEAGTTVPEPPRPRPGEAAFTLFRRLVTYHCDWWAETFTESEYLAVLRALEPTLLVAKQKVDGAATSAMPMPKRPASGKASGSKRSGSAKKKGKAKA